jgi:hypothetical protein
MNRKRALAIGAISAGVLLLALAVMIVIYASAPTPAIVRTVQTPSDDASSTQAPSEFPDHPPAGVALAGTAVAVDGAPFTIASCSGVRTPQSQLWISVMIHNSGTKALASTEVSIAGIDSTGTKLADSDTSLGTFLDDDQESIDPNADYDSTGTFENANPLIASISCTPNKATFEDGTSWTRAGSR